MFKSIKSKITFLRSQVLNTKQIIILTGLFCSLERWLVRRDHHRTDNILEVLWDQVHREVLVYLSVQVLLYHLEDLFLQHQLDLMNLVVLQVQVVP